MTLILDWPPDVVARVTAEARAAGLTVDEYLLRNVQRANEPAAVSPPLDEAAARKRREEAGRRIREISQGKSLPPGETIRDWIEEGRRF